MRVIIDTDAGVDDAVGLMLALGDPAVQLEAITTVTGNIGVDSVVRNVMTTLKVMNREDVPVYRGAEHPLISPWQHETVFVHGNDGLGDWPNRPVSKKNVEAEHAVMAMIRLVNQYPGEITLLALGPMTNLALAIRLDPSFPSKVGRLVWMGGTNYGMGNTEGMLFSSEFNIHIDPEAAHIVLGAFAESIQVSWETSTKHSLSWADFDALAAIKSTPGAQFFQAITAHWRQISSTIPQVKGYTMPDPITVAIALHPELVTHSEHLFVAVELNGAYTRGATLVDFSGFSGQKPNVHCVLEIDQKAFEGLYRRLLTNGTL
ncbi:MAG: nucleoside hydrolase [Anaerolineae bacterium]